MDRARARPATARSSPGSSSSRSHHSARVTGRLLESFECPEGFTEDEFTTENSFTESFPISEWGECYRTISFDRITEEDEDVVDSNVTPTPRRASRCENDTASRTSQPAETDDDGGLSEGEADVSLELEGDAQTSPSTSRDAADAVSLSVRCTTPSHSHPGAGVSASHERSSHPDADTETCMSPSGRDDVDSIAGVSASHERSSHPDADAETCMLPSGRDDVGSIAGVSASHERSSHPDADAEMCMSPSGRYDVDNIAGVSVYRERSSYSDADDMASHEEEMTVCNEADNPHNIHVDQDRDGEGLTSGQSDEDDVDEAGEDEDSDAERVRDLGPLSPLEAAAVGCALEEAVNQLGILAHTARAAKLSADLSSKPLGERLEAIDAKETDRKSSIIQPPHFTEENARVDKIQRDRAMVQEALRLQTAWLRLPPGSFPLRRLVREEERRSLQEARLLAESVRGAQWGREARAQVQAEGKQARRQLRALREERAQLQEEARSLRARTALGAAVTGKWEQARLQQHQRRLQVQEEGLREGLQQVHRHYSEEQRVHNELIEFLRQTIEDLEVQSEEWQARYMEVTAESEEKLSALRARRVEHSRQLRALRKELSRRERFKREFFAYKEMRDRQANERQRANNAATRIQSWWRMTMVRKGLGPYRRVVKKKKKKKK